jgi:hypothetical protein
MVMRKALLSATGMAGMRTFAGAVVVCYLHAEWQEGNLWLAGRVSAVGCSCSHQQSWRQQQQQ